MSPETAADLVLFLTLFLTQLALTIVVLAMMAPRLLYEVFWVGDDVGPLPRAQRPARA